MTRLLRPSPAALVTAAAILAGIALAAAGPAAQEAGTVAIRGATVLTVTAGTISGGTVLIRDGRIAAVGPDVDIPAGADVFDATGLYVTPGLIDAHSHIASDAINEGGTTVSSMTGIEDVFNPVDVNIFRDLAGGLTTANILHGSANPIGGRNLVIKLRWGGNRIEDYVFEGAPPGIKFALGENPKDLRQPWQEGPLRYPVTRMGVEHVIRDAFLRARAYQRAWQEYERRRAAGDDVLPPRRDLQLEPIVEVLEGRRLVHAHCYRADEILMLLRLAEEFGFRIATLQHVLEGYKVADEIREHGAGASTFSDWWGYKIEAVDAIPHNAALMLRRGVLVSINSDSAEHARRLNTEAAKSIKWGGLTDDEALSLVTINPAKQLGIDDRVGSIEPGKDADLAIWNRHPLSSYALVERTYIEGRLYYDRRAEAQRLTRLDEEKALLIAAEGRVDTPPTGDLPQTSPQTPQASAGRATDAGGNGGNGGNGASRGGPAPWRAPSLDPAPASTQGGDRSLAITNARIVTVSGATIERGTIVIRGGLIEAVGPDVTPPPGAAIIDAAGGEVYPGWINARSTLGIAEPGARGYTDTVEMHDLNPHLRTVVAFHPDSDAIPVARANGVTAAAVTPSGGLLGGQIAVMNLDGWTWEEAAVAPAAGMAFQLPEIGSAQGAGAERERTWEDLRKERERRLDELARLFDRARDYARAGADRERDLVLEALVPIVERGMPLVARADSERDIRDAIAFAEEIGVQLVISGGAEAPLVADLLRDKDVPVILGPVLRLPTREDHPHAATYMAAGELHEAGVRFAFATGDHNNARLLPYHASQSVAWGLPREAAIRALTLDAARILGVDDRLGSIEPGRVANLFIANGDPLEIRTDVTHVIVNGRDVGLDNRQQALYERYRER